MSLEKKVGVRVTAKTDQAAQEFDKLGGAADRAADRIKKTGRASKELKEGTASLERWASRATMMFGVAAGGVVAMDKIITSQMRYNALLRNAPFDIKAATEATQGYISQTTLLDSAIAANRAGFIKTSKDYAQFTADVQKMAMATGQDTTEALDVLTRALAKNESELLDNYNINLKVKQAQEMYAEQLGKTASALTEEEKATAFGIIGMQKIREVAAKANVQLELHEQWWLKIKAAILDFPATMTAATNGIENFFVKVDHWQKVTGMTIRGETLQMGDHRRGAGVRGMKNVMDDRWLQFVSDTDKMTPALTEWKARQDEHGKFVGETGAKAMVDAAENAAKAMILGEKKKGKKSKFAWSAMLQNEIRNANNAEMMSRDRSDSRDYAAGLLEARNADLLREANERAVKGAADLELKKAEVALEARLMGLEMMEARGVSPAQLADAELQAQEKMLEAKERYIAATMKGEERLMAMEELHAERRKVHHARDLAAIKADLKAREKQKAAMTAMGDSIVDVHAGVAAAAIAGAFASDQSVKQAVAGFAKAKGIEMTILAATESIKAIAAAASFNFVGAQAHGTAAAMAAAEAGVLLALAGATGGFSGGAGKGKVSRPGASAGGHSIGPGASGGRSSNAGAPPISRLPGPIAPPMSGGNSTTNHVVIQNYSVLPPDTDQQMIKLRRMLADSQRDNPRV